MPLCLNPVQIRCLVFMPCCHMSPSAQTYDSTSVHLSVFAPTEVPDYIEALVSWLFGCHHHHVSRVFTIQRRTYQVCFDCSAELSYSWDRMYRTHLRMFHTADSATPMDVTYRDSGDSGDGLPLAVSVESASLAERRFVEAALDGCFLDETSERLIGDKAYDSDVVDAQMNEYGIELISPNRSNRKRKTQDGCALRRYRHRWKVKRLLAWMHNYRRLVMRWGYHIENFLGFVHLTCLLIFLRHL